MIIILIIPTAVITFGLLPKAIWPWVLFSLTSFCATLSYSGLSDYFPLNYAGRVSTAVNLITFLVAFIAQYAIGAIMQFIEPGKNDASDDDDPFEVSDAETMLKYIKGE